MCVEGGSDSRDREIEQAESWSSDNRAGSVTRLQQTHRKSSFPVGLRMHRAMQPGHVGPADRPIGQLKLCRTTQCRGVVRFLKARLRFSYTSWLAAWQCQTMLLTLKGTQTVDVVLLCCSLREVSLPTMFYNSDQRHKIVIKTTKL